MCTLATPGAKNCFLSFENSISLVSICVFTNLSQTTAALHFDSTSIPFNEIVILVVENFGGFTCTRIIHSCILRKIILRLSVCIYYSVCTYYSVTLTQAQRHVDVEFEQGSAYALQVSQSYSASGTLRDKLFAHVLTLVESVVLVKWTQSIRAFIQTQFVWYLSEEENRKY